MDRKTDIVVTTIFEPTWLEGYLDNIRQHDRLNDVTIRIICDKKTPSTVYEAAQRAKKMGFNIDCPELDEQEQYLQKIGLPAEFIPWNTDNRRNIGFLRAWETGADVLISIDDDNYVLGDSDFVGEHHAVGASVDAQPNARWAGNGSWFNICDLLDSDAKQSIYARGYPYASRNTESQALLTSIPADQESKRVAINAGLWTDDPDVDAISRLAIGPRVTGSSDEAVLLSPETWSPINTQNTALIREAIPAYYYVRMGFQLQGLTIDRFGDILSGYFVQKCARHLEDVVRLGSPTAEHRRTPHNLFKDLYFELAGIVIIEELLPWLQEIRLDGDDYPAAYESLAEELEAVAGEFSGFVWNEGGCEFLRETARAMKTWLGVIKSLG